MRVCRLADVPQPTWLAAPGAAKEDCMAVALPIISADSGLTRYLAEIRRFPMLAAEEEYMLAKR